MRIIRLLGYLFLLALITISCMTQNILFICCDQLRRDFLSCYSDAFIETPNIDWLAANGVRFDATYIQSPTCGPSRASMYSGQYVFTHGATYNQIPLSVHTRNIGDHLNDAGMRAILLGKSHMRADVEGMQRLGIDPNSDVGQRLRQAGFEIYERDDGIHSDPIYSPTNAYDQYLREQGYNNENPWDRNANGVRDENGEFVSGWDLRSAQYPADIAEEHSETPYLTRRAIEFLEEVDDAKPWCLHLSYIKPHWPYVVPDPYFSMYQDVEFPEPNRSETEREDAHPVFAAMRDTRISKTFAREDVRDAAIRAYAGLVKQIDDQMGVLFDYLRKTGRIENTVIVFTSDHGDYLGDHWMGEKNFFFEESVRVPLLIFDPSKAADATRGTVCRELTELIDLLPTFVEIAGGKPHFQLEGQSLLPYMHDKSTENRTYAVCELDYSCRPEHDILQHSAASASRAYMLCTSRWKYTHFDGYRPMLFDLENDPNERIDLGAHPDFEQERIMLKGMLFDWLTQRQSRMYSNARMATHGTLAADDAEGVWIGVWDHREELDPSLWYENRGPLGHMLG